jgi:hypothetical protein
MKLRILNQSVRFRLQRSEAAQLASNGTLSSITRLAGRELTYRLDGGSQPTPQLTWDGSELVVAIPAADLTAWAKGEEVGWYGQIADVTVTIEKDFQRTHVRTELDGDLYPNPRRAQSPPS